MRSCCVQTKQSSLIYHVEIVTKGIKGVSCRAEEGFIYFVWWGDIDQETPLVLISFLSP